MNRSRLFQYAIIWHPTEKQVKEDGLKPIVLVEPKTVLGQDDKSVTMSAAMDIDPKYKDQLDQIEIAVRAF